MGHNKSTKGEYIMDKKKFETIASNSGYCSLKESRKYIEESGKADFTEKDLEEVWRIQEAKISSALNKSTRISYFSNDHNKGRRTKRYKQSERMGSPNNN